MATNTTVLFRGAASTSSTTLYTVPAGRTAVVTNIVVTNTGTSAATWTMTLNGVSIGTTVAIAANQTAVIDMKQVLAATNTITGLASTTSVNFHISGIEVF